MTIGGERVAGECLSIQTYIVISIQYIMSVCLDQLRFPKPLQELSTSDDKCRCCGVAESRIVALRPVLCCDSNKSARSVSVSWHSVIFIRFIHIPSSSLFLNIFVLRFHTEQLREETLLPDTKSTETLSKHLQDG